MGKSTAIGTAHTTAVINYLKPHGFGNAELRNLAGIHDKGDIVGTPGVVWECKGGHAAETASDLLVTQWLAETERERRNASADIGVLVLKRKAIGTVNAGRYWAILPFWQIVNNLDSHNDTALRGTAAVRMVNTAPVRLYLHDAVHFIRATGYGDPL
jgi:hypothetical protein